MIRRGVGLFLFVVLACGGKSVELPEAARFECPDGTHAKHRSLGGQSVRWCVDSAGLREGTSVSWDDDTHIVRMVARDHRDKLHGPATYFHKNGTKAAEGRYVAGTQDGEWRTWDENGSLIKVSVYDAALGRLVSEEMFKPGDRDR